MAPDRQRRRIARLRKRIRCLEAERKVAEIERRPAQVQAIDDYLAILYDNLRALENGTEDQLWSTSPVTFM